MYNNSRLDNSLLSKKLNEYFKENIKLSLKTEFKVYLVTNDDIFYEINIYDENIQSFISSEDNSIVEKMIIKNLCHKEIIDLTYSEAQFYVKTLDKKIYSWGLTNKCENVSKDNLIKNCNKAELNEILSDLKIDVIKCGAYHSLALTQNGDVYIWGWTRFNQEVSAGFGFIPIKVNFPEKVVIKQISCSSVHSLALTENDRVYIFGDRPSGIEDNQESLTPKRIELNDLISKISCGHYHSLLLSNDGVIYAIGKVFSAESVKISENSDINEIRLKPSKLIHKKKFIDIACHWKEHISIALSSDNIYHVWGESEADNFHIPIETTFESFNEIFIYYCDYDFEISEKLSEFKDLHRSERNRKRKLWKSV
jgi:alpha-tubulin suppressor-like RCC1 family protein